MDAQYKLGSGRIILISAALAVLLLALDAWSHSLLTMVGIAVVALMVFIGLRKPEPELTDLDHLDPQQVPLRAELEEGP